MEFALLVQMPLASTIEVHLERGLALLRSPFIGFSVVCFDIAMFLFGQLDNSKFTSYNNKYK